MKLDIWSIIRYILVGIGSAMGVDGAKEAAAVPAGEWGPEHFQALGGTIVAIAAAAWGIYVRFGTRAVPIHIAERADVPTVSSATGQVKEGPGA